MGHRTLPGNPPIDISLRPSARARRVSLRVSGLDGRVTLTYPAGTDAETALGFAQGKAGWIREKLSERAAPVDVAPGAVLPLEGRLVAVREGRGRSARYDGASLVVPGDRAGVTAVAYLRALARDRLSAAADRHAAHLGRPYTRITLRDTRSRWGSCSSRGALMFSWRLVMAPPDVLDYVAAHEVAHLAHMHHGRAFWAEVERLFGDYTGQRAWLRREGPALHRYRFGD